MKKSIKKLHLKKNTLTNLAIAELSARHGGAPTNGNACQPYTHTCTHDKFSCRIGCSMAC